MATQMTTCPITPAAIATARPARRWACWGAACGGGHGARNSGMASQQPAGTGGSPGGGSS
jgi:hypothetical protein